MRLRVLFLCITLFVQLNFYAQDVIGVHQVQKGIQENEYLIKTSISGLKNVDIAKLVVEIDSTHQFKKSANNPYFFNRKGQEVKFYIMGIPPAGEISLDFSIILSGQEDYSFPVKFQYSKNEEKNVATLSEIKISALPLLAVETQNINQVNEKVVKEEQEKLLAEQKLEEEKLAKNIARFNAEQAERLALAKAEEEKAKELANEKAKTDETANKEAERLAAEKLKQETERLALAKAEEEKAKKIANEKAKAEEAVKMEAERLAAEKLKKEAERLALAKAEKEKEEKAKELANEKANKEATTSSKKYSVQLLSLAQFTEDKLAAYCKKHNLSMSEIVKRQSGGLTKISYGKVNSKEEASKLQQKLKQQHQINESFVVLLP